MGFATWANSCYISTKRNEQRIDRVTDYLGKYFLYNVNVITTHGIRDRPFITVTLTTIFFI